MGSSISYPPSSNGVFHSKAKYSRANSTTSTMMNIPRACRSDALLDVFSAPFVAILLMMYENYRRHNEDVILSYSYHKRYCSLKMIGRLKGTLTGVPRCLPGSILGNLSMMRLASVSRLLSGPRN